jgi:hypothetical protein
LKDQIIPIWRRFAGQDAYLHGKEAVLSGLHRAHPTASRKPDGFAIVASDD